MKPSLRRDSLEKAARKFSDYTEATLGILIFDDERGPFMESIASLLQRHGAKVRRETLKEAHKLIIESAKLRDEKRPDFADGMRFAAISLTPR